LFFDYPKQARISIAAGSLDDTSDLSTAGHIYCVEAGQYYSLPADSEMVDDGEFSLDCPE